MGPQLLDLARGSAGALALSAAALALPAPAACGSRFYAWFYHFTRLILANFDKAGVGNDLQPGSH